MADRHCISMQIGQCGIQMGNSMWELFCVEQNIGPDGMRLGKESVFERNNSRIHSFFYEKSQDRFSPRSVLADLEPSVLDELRSGTFKDLFDPGSLVSGVEDAASNFGRGFYTIGKDKLESTMETVRKVAEQCGTVEGFLLFHSCGGGTGSGFGPLVMNSVVDEYPKKSKLEFVVFPAPQVSSSVVEPYNAVLSLHSCLSYEHADCTFYIDNESLYDISQKKLNIFRPTFTTLNRICAQAVSSITASLRFECELNVEMSDFKLNLVPFPGLRYLVISYAPITTPEKVFHDNLSVKNITSEAFAPRSQLVKCDLAKGKYMACCLLYRGDVVPSDINDAIQVIKSRKTIHFVDWCPTGVKIGMNQHGPMTFPDDTAIAGVQRAVCVLANSTAIVELWERLGKKFDLMFKERAFTHWYLREGVEEHEFVEARKDLEMLKHNYKEMESSAGLFPKIPNEF